MQVTCLLVSVFSTVFRLTLDHETQLLIYKLNGIILHTNIIKQLKIKLEYVKKYGIMQRRSLIAI